MFMDGLWYATLARNLSLGLGTPFAPQLTETLGQHFVSHPPLMWGAESLLFRLLGDHWWVERIFSGGMIVLAGLALWRSWQRLPGSGGTATGWLPLLLWVIMPLLPWATANHMLENVLLATLGWSLYAWLRFQANQRWGWLCLAGLGLWLGLWTKGPPALFVLSLPIWVGLSVPGYGWRRGARDSLLLAALVAALTGLLLCWPPAWQFAQGYLDTFLRGNLAVQVVSSRWLILGKWLQELLPPLLLSGLILWGLRRYRVAIAWRGWPLALWLTGLSGVLPYCLVLKQRGFYVLPALPYVALTLALLLAPTWQRWWDSLRPSARPRRLWHAAGWSLLLVALAVAGWSVGRPGRHASALALAQGLRGQVPAHSRLGSCDAQWQNWSLHGYLYREAFISLDRGPEAHAYLLGGPLCPATPPGDTLLRSGAFSPLIDPQTGLWKTSEACLAGLYACLFVPLWAGE
jgi:hypothetical protein